MTRLLDDRRSMLGNFTDSALRAPASAIPWLQRLRRDALERFQAAGFPTTRDEEWRLTNVAPIARTAFDPAPAQMPPVAGELAGEFSFGADAAAEIVLVNGRFAPQLSRTGELPAGVRVASLAEAMQESPELVERHLGRYVDLSRHPFAALNTAHLHDGAFIHVPRGAQVRRPIHVLCVSVPGERPTAAYPRVLAVFGENAQATLVESYVGAGKAMYFTGAVTEIIAEAGAHIDHCKLQQSSLEAWHIAAMQVQLARGATFISHSATLGGRLTRNDLDVILDGEGADATLNGLVIIGGEQHVDNHTLLKHEKPNCPSHELYKHVLDGRSSAVFKGKIFVQKGAQKTDSKQTSKSLLLSDEATMNSQPALEIYADDVKCTHGSTTGPVDEEQVFYLRSRGVSLEAARHLLTYAFAADITRRIRVEPVRRRLEDFMAAQHGLPQDLRITDLGAHDEKAR